VAKERKKRGNPKFSHTMNPQNDWVVGFIFAIFSSPYHPWKGLIPSQAEDCADGLAKKLKEGRSTD